MAAIYQWLTGNFTYIVQTLTTTLYPIEAFDSLTFSTDISTESSMSPIPGDEIDVSADLLSVTLTTILLEYGPVGKDAVDLSADIISLTLTQILLEHGPTDDAVDLSADLISIELNSLLVTIDTPDEQLQLDMNIYPSGCSMTPV